MAERMNDNLSVSSAASGSTNSHTGSVFSTYT